MPDKVIAFDELPEDLVKGFELCRADGFPRHWKQWLGKKTKVTQAPPERDALTGQVRRFDPIIEEDSFFYLVDWTLGPVVEKWKMVCDYVRQNVSKDVRLSEKIDDMALPLAPNKTDGVTLEPEDVVIIPLPAVNAALADARGNELLKTAPINLMKCTAEGCTSEFEGKFARNALRMHTQKKHKKEVAPV